MAFTIRIFAYVIMSLIVVFSLIHLGVSIGIIVVYRKYDDIFRPLVGLSSFNLVICFFGFLTGILGLLAIRANSQRFGRIVAIIAILLFILTLASLVAAIVINAKSPDYVRSHITLNMLRFETDPNARKRINDMHDAYSCCGSDLWLDWANVKLNEIPIGTNVTGTTTLTTSVPVTNASTVAPMTTESTVGPVTTESTASSTSITDSTSEVTQPQTVASTVTNEVSTTTTTASGAVKRALSSIYDYFYPGETLHLIESPRNKRQTIEGMYGGISGLPLGFSVVLPESCCGANAKVFNGSSSLFYCLSSVDGSANEFTPLGCVKSVETVASNQAMGLGIINSFLVVLAFAAIPIMLEIESFIH